MKNRKIYLFTVYIFVIYNIKTVKIPVGIVVFFW